MEKKNQIILVIIALVAVVAVTVVALGISATGSVSTNATTQNQKTITDMFGRTVVVPADVTRVLSTGPPTTIEVYVLAPDKLIGINFNPNKASDGSVYLPEKYQDLPNVGGWYGTFTGNYETFISMNPDVVFDGGSLGSGNYTDTINDRQQNFGNIPVVGIADATNVTQYDGSIIFMGNLLGAEDQADSLLEFYHRVLLNVTTTVATIPTGEKVTVYYAEGPKGLQTDPAGSSHSELIDLAGGINVADCAITPGNGKTAVSLEQITTWNPDVIIAGDPTFYAGIYNDTLWQEIPAVKNHRVYLVPQSPFTWFDRPPGVNRIMGIPWTAKCLYPDKFAGMDLSALTKEFYTKFYHYNLTDSEVNTLLNP
jgi:iron complex transport system substrate-binding protein